MKVEQDKPAYKPVTITLETREEAELLLGIAECTYTSYQQKDKERDFLLLLSNLLSNITL